MSRYEPTQEPVPEIAAVPRPRLVGCLLGLLVPSALVCVLLSPLGFLLSLFPVTLLVGLPLCLSTTIILLLALAWIPYLLFAQDDLPAHSTLLLPLSPIKAQRIVTTLITHFILILRLNWIELLLDYSYRKLILIRATNSVNNPIIRRDILYKFADEPLSSPLTKRLDVYLPPSFNTEPDPAPVFVFIHPGGWRWFNKSHFLQLGLRIRRLGFCVVIPDFTQFPEGRCQSSIEDISCALRWVSQSIGQYGGDPSRIFLSGHGSGAHLALLTVLESAIRSSISDFRSASPSGWRTADEERESLQLPTIEGMILLSGIYDPINQLRDEVHAGWHQILATRRAIGPTHSLSISNSPTHLLHMAQDFLKPGYLPPKFLIIHGGQDRNVPILQSHLLSKLLENINRQGEEEEEGSSMGSLGSPHKSVLNRGPGPKPAIQVIFKPFKNLDHMNCLFALMLNPPNPGHHHHANGYRQAIVDLVLGLVD